MMSFLADTWIGLLAGSVSFLLLWYMVRTARKQLPITDESHTDVTVSVDDQGLTMSLGNRELRSLKWTDVELVRLRTTADGPFSEDVFWEWELNDGSSKLTIPNGAKGVDSLLQVAPRHLPDFDHDAVIEAMTSMEEDTFMVWERNE